MTTAPFRTCECPLHRKAGHIDRFVMASCTNILSLVTQCWLLVHLKAQVVHTGSTSIHVFVLVETVVPKTRLPHETDHCIITFVAMSEAVELVSVPYWE